MYWPKVLAIGMGSLNMQKYWHYNSPNQTKPNNRTGFGGPSRTKNHEGGPVEQKSRTKKAPKFGRRLSQKKVGSSTTYGLAARAILVRPVFACFWEFFQSPLWPPQWCYRKVRDIFGNGRSSAPKSESIAKTIGALLLGERKTFVFFETKLTFGNDDHSAPCGARQKLETVLELA